VTPVETLWITLVLIFAVVGVVRGFLKELGVTLVLIVTLFGLTQLSNNFKRVMEFAATTTSVQAVRQVSDKSPWLLVFYVFALLGAMFIAYQGYVIKYPGNEPPGIQGVLLSFMIGAINGYLVSGSLWYYANKYQEPIRQLGLLQGDYTPLAQKLIQVLPPNLLIPYLPFLIVFLIILLVIK
jgi:uncharacterized membrane protein required for colicin V production